jgi:hypothetical protein
LEKLRESNEVRSHQGRWCYGKTPLPTFVDSIALAKEKTLATAVLEQRAAQG